MTLRRRSSSFALAIAALVGACFSDTGGTGTSSITDASGSTSDGSGSTSDGSGPGTTGTSTSAATDDSSTSRGTSVGTSVGTSDGTTAAATSVGTSDATTDVTVSTTAEPTTTTVDPTTTAGDPTGTSGLCGDGVLDPGEECDNGGDNGGFECSEECIRLNRYVFLTSKTYTGALDGLDGADSRCQLLAAEAGLPGNYRAWLSTPNASAATRLTHSVVPYTLVSGVPVAYSWNDLVSTGLIAPILLDENGQNIASAPTCLAAAVWTATTSTGDHLGVYCEGWTVNAKSSGQLGLQGDVKQWTESACVKSCDSQARLYCFEQ